MGGEEEDAMLEPDNIDTLDQAQIEADFQSELG